MKRLPIGLALFICLPLAAKPIDSLDFKIGQLFIVGFRGVAVSEQSPIVQDIQRRHLGGVILFEYDVVLKQSGRNVQSPTQVKSLCAALQSYAKTKLLISIDEEGGKVNRLKPKYGFPPTVSAGYLGQLGSLDSARFYATQTASLLSDLGVNLNLAPVCDVNVNPQNPAIGKVERSFSSNPDSVVLFATEVINAHRAKNVLTCVKHFPSYGSLKNDPHWEFADVTDAWRPIELKPFQALISQGRADMVMTAHILNAKWDTLPATLSRKAIQDMLRNEMGFDGVVCSDDMQMKAIAARYGLEQALKLALNAGVDMFIFGNNLDYDEQIAAKAIAIVKRLIERGEVKRERVEEAYRRIAALKARLK
ncbi:MAG: glycoside hydrolase family 3 protein [Chloroherpetonaceae bacterium]|nr:glycoside hydrolase family 3 protein [Chloroherpetonaceae bacterium]MDW8438150.1 glycoside hydrolase family 3 protein [Chloroherpetonaceae bacterium]